MKKRAKRNYDEVDYWESMADILVCLLLCVLLITLLLVLYLVRIPDNDYIDEELGSSYAEYDDPDDGSGNYGHGNTYKDEGDDWYRGGGHDDGDGHDGGWYSGGGAGGEGVGPGKYDDPDPGAGEGQGVDKAAVFVQVVDGETGRTIKQQGMEFELYSERDALQVLKTYYPKVVEYKKYETEPEGVFYLPETISLGGYYLHNLTPVEGYETADKTAFVVEQSYDWADPYVATVSLYPSRSTIRVQLKDQDSGKKLSGASFRVVAAEDIVTKDGTTRYRAGQAVDTITLDQSGYGESVLLYLGKYRLEQAGIPEHYAEIDAAPTVMVKTQSGNVKPALTELGAQKTTVQVELVDALSRGKGLAGVSFTFSENNGGNMRRLTTDENGRISITDLKAGTTYRLRQITTLPGYYKDTTDYLLQVDTRGRIEDAAVTELTLTNTILRVSIGVRDKIFRGLVSDENVAVYDADGTVVKVWNSTALEQVLEGLKPGEYRVVINGREDSAYQILVQETFEMQSFYFDQWTTADIGAMLGLALFLIAVITLVVYLVLRKHRGKRE